MILKVKAFEILKGFQIRVTFNNGDTRVVDLSNELNGEIFEPLKDESYFKKAFLTEWNVIEWKN
jgi:hypothetical protein